MCLSPWWSGFQIPTRPGVPWRSTGYQSSLRSAVRFLGFPFRLHVNREHVLNRAHRLSFSLTMCSCGSVCRAKSRVVTITKYPPPPKKKVAQPLTANSQLVVSKLIWPYIPVGYLSLDCQRYFSVHIAQSLYCIGVVYVSLNFRTHFTNQSFWSRFCTIMNLRNNPMWLWATSTGGLTTASNGHMGPDVVFNVIFNRFQT